MQGKILAISGRLLENSFNTALARAGQHFAPAHLNVIVYYRLRDISPYDHDIDRHSLQSPPRTSAIRSAPPMDSSS